MTGTRSWPASPSPEAERLPPPWQAAAWLLLVALPWLVPPQRPPSVALLPWLCALGCTAILTLLARPRLPLWLCAALLLAAALAAWPVATVRDGLWLALVASLTVLALGAAALRSGGPQALALRAEWVAAAWLAAALASAVIGLCQYFQVEHHVWFMSEAPGREPYGNLRQRNHYATLLNIGLAALLWLATRSAPTRRALLATVGAAALLVAAQAATGSRTGLLQLLVLTAAAAWWWRPALGPLRGFVVALPLGYALATVLLPLLAGLEPGQSGILARLQPNGMACATRWTLWRDAWELALARPWTGWGWGELDYAHFVTEFDHPRHCELIDNAHNLPLHLAVEFGLPLTALALGALLVLAWRQARGLRTDAVRQLGALVLGLLLLHSLLEYPLWYGPFQMAAGLALGLLLRPPAAPAEVRPAGSARCAGLIAAVLLALGGWAAWDYLRTSQVYVLPAQRWAPYRADALAQARRTWFFGPQARFAELSLTPLTPQTAAHVHELALQSLHYTPEPRVVEALIGSARLLGREEEARHYERLYRAAYPRDYARWQAQNGQQSPPR
ncbi:MAG: Wzy polymerase domain-containing protein [Hylemonella sp.]